MENNFYNDLILSPDNMMKIIAEVSYICNKTYCDRCVFHSYESGCLLRKYSPSYWSALVKKIKEDLE